MTLPEGTLLTTPLPGAEAIYQRVQAVAGIPTVVQDWQTLATAAAGSVRLRVVDGRVLGDFATSGPLLAELDGPAVARWFADAGLAKAWGHTPSARDCELAAAELNRRGLAEFERRQVAAQAEADRTITALEREATEDREARLRALRERVDAELAALEATPASPAEPAERPVPGPPKRLWQR